MGDVLPAGDANLDGNVDELDFNTLRDHLFMSDVSWSDGDFDLNGSVDVADFNIWNDHRDTPSSTIPEPSGLTILIVIAVGISFQRGYRRGRFSWHPNSR